MSTTSQAGITVDPQIQQWFKSIDVNGNGQLDCNELQRALALGNLNFGLSDIDSMIRTFDTTNTRTLDITEFTRLHSFLINVQNSFNQFDKDRSRSLDAVEVGHALQAAGFSLDQPALEALVRRSDQDGSGNLTLDEYIRTCLLLQTAVRTFSAFDFNRQGSINLTFNQFVYACSHVCG